MRANSLCTPFLYLLAFLSKIVYLSFANISGSVGISSFQCSTAFVVVPCFFNALSTVATMASIRRRRKRWRAFWNLERRHGIFLDGELALWRGNDAQLGWRKVITIRDLLRGGLWAWRDRTWWLWCVVAMHWKLKVESSRCIWGSRARHYSTVNSEQHVLLEYTIAPRCLSTLR